MSAENGEQILDAQVVEEVSTVPDLGALVPTGGTELAVTPTVTAGELVERLSVIAQAQSEAMNPEIDYGVIPGTKKPTLLKPGAEKLSVLFQLDVQIVNDKRWEADNHLTVTSRATAFHAPTGARLGYGEGICSTRERKYAYRQAKPKCPSCNEETIFRSKNDGEGWFCWKKKGGCGAQFAADAKEIVGQEVGQVDNPDLPDTWNTVVKMAEKRARVDVVLAVTGASALFTQDVEDGQPSPDQERQAPPSSPPEPVVRLNPERVDRILGGFGALKLSSKDIGLMLGACNVDAPSAWTAEGIKARIAGLGEVEADKLEAEQAKAAQDAETEAPDEAPESGDGGE